MWWAAAALAAHERRVSPRAAEATPLTDGPKVSVIVPARNEEREISATVGSLLGQRYANLEILVVDDQSTDGTAAEARHAAGTDPRATVLAGRPLPDGWVGKSWAAWQGYEHASGEWLLFTDADVEHSPDSIACAMSLARERGTGVTIVPRIDTGSVAEAVVLPAAFAMIGTFVAPGPLVRRPGNPTAMAAGGYMLVPRRDYERVGGHRGIRGRMIDDMSLAQNLKRARRPLLMAEGADLARLRMYRGAKDMWNGWRKNASFGAAGPAQAVVGSGLVAASALVGPIAVAGGLRSARPTLTALGLVGWLAQAVVARVNQGAVDSPRRFTLAFPVGVAFIAATAWRGVLDRLTGAGPLWRGRRYPRAN